MDNLINLAPAVTHADGIEQDWLAQQTGADTDFFSFITTPSAARTLFLLSRARLAQPQGVLLVNIYS